MLPIFLQNRMNLNVHFCHLPCQRKCIKSTKKTSHMSLKLVFDKQARFDFLLLYFLRRLSCYALCLKKWSGMAERWRPNRQWAVMGLCDATGMRMKHQQKGFALKKLKKRETAICCLSTYLSIYILKNLTFYTSNYMNQTIK